MTTCDREQKTLDWYTDRFEREYRDAKTEYLRLASLFDECCWYHFETACRGWQAPWRATEAESHIELHGMQFHRKWNRGCLIEHGRFPMWYEGPVRDAPLLPPQIVQKELEDAKAYMEACATQVRAPYEWAPGGSLYEELRRITPVGHVPPGSQCVYDPRKRKFSSC
jgi:hypothetical protein